MRLPSHPHRSQFFSMFEPSNSKVYFKYFESLLSSFDHKIENGNLKHVPFERIPIKIHRFIEHKKPICSDLIQLNTIKRKSVGFLRIALRSFSNELLTEFCTSTSNQPYTLHHYTTHLHNKLRLTLC